MVISFIQLNGERGRKLAILGFVLGELLEMEKVTSMEWLMKYLSGSTMVNLLKELYYSIMNNMIQHISGEHVNTITTK